VTQQRTSNRSTTAEVEEDGGASRARLTSSIPVRFPEETLLLIRERAGQDHRTVSSWIRHVVQQELERASAEV
jgi:hypothetical protein